MATKEWKLKNQDKMRQYRRDWYQRNKERAKSAIYSRRLLMKDWLCGIKLELSCINCGESDPCCLDFHHTDPSKKEFSLAEAVGRGLSKEKIKKEIDKTQILCANCHRKHHYSDRVQIS